MLSMKAKAEVWPFAQLSGPGVRVLSAQGDRLRLSNGSEWLDAAAGAAVGNIGWGRKEVVDAIADSTRDLTYVLPNMQTQERLELVSRLRSDWLPPDLAHLYFASSGSEAVDAAIRLARLHHALSGRTKRWKVIGRDISYHGTTLASLSVGGHAARRRHFEPLLHQAPLAPPAFCHRCAFGRKHPECGIACGRELEAIIAKQGPDTISAFIAEPIVGSSGGAVVPPDEYWPIVSEICKQHRILLIVDEVLTGFGRTGERFGINHWDVSPDIMVLGKGLSGGYAALSAIAAKESVIEPLIRNDTTLMFYTFGGLPSACAGANEVLKILDEEDLITAVAEKEDILRRALDRLRAHPNVADVRGRGFLWAVEIVESRHDLSPFPVSFNATKRVIDHAKDHGVLFYGGGTEAHRDIIMIAPHFISDAASLSRIAVVLEAAINAVAMEKRNA